MVSARRAIEEAASAPAIETVARYDEFLAFVRGRLAEKKIEHCLSVTRYLASFAPDVGLAHEAAVTAGVLHDIARKLDNEELLERARNYGIPVNRFQRQKPRLLHGPVAAEEARDVLGIDDPEVYDAIYWHTTGRPEYCRLGQALYLADFSEPLRTYPEAAEARTLLERQGFDTALVYVARVKIGFLHRKAVMDPVSEDFYAWLRRTRMHTDTHGHTRTGEAG